MNKKNTKNTRKTGTWGEEMAAAYLESQGVKIIERNIFTAYGEIDLLGEQDGQIIFIEVKTLRSKKFGDPEVSVSTKKQEHMANSALYYLQQNDLLHREWRIDVIALLASPSCPIEFKWFKNAINE